MISPLLDDPVRGVRITAARVLVDTDRSAIPIVYQPSWESAIDEYKQSLFQNADFPSGQFQLGQFYDLRNEQAEAIKAYLKALKIDSLMNGPRINLARLSSTCC